MPNRFGPENVRAAAVLLLTLPGLVFLYQGEEIGQVDGPASETAHDRAGRDPFRHPVQWDPEPQRAGVTTGTPWLAPVDAAERSVATQSGDPDSLLELYWALIALRPSLGPALSMREAAPGVLSYTRGDHLVVVNTTSDPWALSAGSLAPRTAAVIRKD